MSLDKTFFNGCRKIVEKFGRTVTTIIFVVVYGACATGSLFFPPNELPIILLLIPSLISTSILLYLLLETFAPKILQEIEERTIRFEFRIIISILVLAISIAMVIFSTHFINQSYTAPWVASVFIFCGIYVMPDNNRKNESMTKGELKNEFIESMLSPEPITLFLGKKSKSDKNKLKALKKIEKLEKEKAKIEEEYGIEFDDIDYDEER